MSLPKRDGVNGRYYLIHKPDTDPEVLEHADQCIQDVLDGTAKENHSGYPVVVRNQSGTPFLPSQLLERYLSKLPLKGFPYEEAAAFCDALRRLAGWNEISHALRQYIEKQVQERYFLVGEREDGFTVFPPCTVRLELRPEDVDEGLLRFACYVAVCHTVYGASYDSLTTEHILGLVSQLRPDMVKQLKTAGSGKLPKDIQRRKTEHFTASANDVFATIRITARDSTEECYAEILDYLCAVLEQEGFPRSYSVEFRGKEKLYLPIPGLPKKGVNQLFACAVQHPNLHPAMARYARLAMREFEWYQNLSDEACAMPGTFAVFALGLEGEPWAPLVTEYLDLCDDEHSSLQGKFLHALIRKFGFQPWTLGVLVRGALSMQWLEPAREFRSLIANAESLDALLAVKRRFSAYLLPEENKDPKFRAIAWQSLLWAIWGTASENGGSKVIKTAPKELKEKYGISAELINLHSLVPLDYTKILESVKKTGKVVLASDACARGSFLDDVAKNITTLAFDYLDAPPAIVGAQNWITPPFEYDKYFFPQKEWILDAINEKIMPLKDYKPVTNMTAEEEMRKLKLGV